MRQHTNFSRSILAVNMYLSPRDRRLQKLGYDL